MKKLEILFGQNQHLSISGLMRELGANKSEISRAAMQLGLMQIKEINAMDKQSAQDLVAMNDFKSKQ
tara:strand:+ start:48 stop:248 length:201 start_codon:yes stop_codon:yes gene_type:complete